MRCWWLKIYLFLKYAKMKKIWTTILENIIIFGGIWAFLYFLAEEQQKTWTTRSRNARKGIVSEYYEWRILIFAVTIWIILYLILDKKRYELRCKIRLRSIGILLFFAFFTHLPQIFIQDLISSLKKMDYHFLPLLYHFLSRLECLS